MSAIRVPWSSASFLVYLGGLTILAALGSLLAVQAGQYGSAAFAGWAVLIFVLVSALALAARQYGHRVTAGMLALSAAAAYVVLLAALLRWFGWLAEPQSPFGGFRVSLLFIELSIVAAAGIALLVFRFPLLMLFAAHGFWFFVTDLISNGGDWSAVVTILVGFVLLACALALDRGGTRPYAFWLHVVAGLTIGGGVLWFLHKGDADWIVVALIALLYIWVGDRLLRSSWVVLGAWALLQSTAYFAVQWANSVSSAIFVVFYLFPFVLADAFDDPGLSGQPSHTWAAPLTFLVVGALLVGLGLVIARRRRETIQGAELL